jgi:hypothetical protein
LFAREAQTKWKFFLRNNAQGAFIALHRFSHLLGNDQCIGVPRGISFSTRPVERIRLLGADG